MEKPKKRQWNLILNNVTYITTTILLVIIGLWIMSYYIIPFHIKIWKTEGVKMLWLIAIEIVVTTIFFVIMWILTNRKMDKDYKMEQSFKYCHSCKNKIVYEKLKENRKEQ